MTIYFLSVLNCFHLFDFVFQAVKLSVNSEHTCMKMLVLFLVECFLTASAFITVDCSVKDAKP